MALAVALFAGSAGCGANALGHSRFYEPLDAERAALEGAEELDPVMSKRMPDEWRKKRISVFGVVERRRDLGGGRIDVALSVRTLEARNLCETSDESSCRTTVSEREHGKLHARFAVASAIDEIGPESIGVGSLLRLVGSLAEEVDVDDGSQVIDASFYRHWPRGTYVTTAAAAVLRR